MTDLLRQVFINVRIDATPSTDFEPVSHGLTMVQPDDDNTSSPNKYNSPSNNDKEQDKQQEHKEKGATTNTIYSTSQDPNDQPSPPGSDDELDEKEHHQEDFSSQFHPNKKKIKIVLFERYELKMVSLKTTVRELIEMLNLNLVVKDEVQEDMGIVRKAKQKSPNEHLVIIKKHYYDSILSLSYKNDVLDDNKTLREYDIATNVYGYVELELGVYTTHGAPEAVSTLVMGHPPVGAPEGKAAKTNPVATWTPLQREATHWPNQPGPPAPKAYLLHAIRCGGTTGIIRVFEKYAKHARNVEECLWALLIAGARSNNAIAFRKRLVFDEKVLTLIKYAMSQFPEHVGVQKQALGLLHYLISTSGEYDAYQDICIAIATVDFNAKILNALSWSSEMLTGIKKMERMSTRGSCLGDVIEYGCLVLFGLVNGLCDPPVDSERWNREDDTPQLGKARASLQKNVKKECRDAEERKELLSQAKVCVEGCAFEETAVKAVDGLLGLVVVNK